MPLRLEKVTRENCTAWTNFLQIYVHELSAFTNAHASDDGIFPYSLTELCLEEEQVSAWYILIKGKRAGFLVVEELTDGSRIIRDYFLLNAYRGLGLGREAAIATFCSWPGRWKVAAVESSPHAKAFWRRVLRSVLPRRFRSVHDRSTGLLIFEFEVDQEEVGRWNSALLDHA
jgi:predicted acetyltransferase